jgi:hypothetical protein
VSASKLAWSTWRIREQTGLAEEPGDGAENVRVIAEGVEREGGDEDREAVSDGVHGGLDPVVQAKLGEDAGDVVLDGVLAQREDGPDLAVGLTGR